MKNKNFRLLLAVCAGIFLGINGVNADNENLARFQFESAKESANWFEGFAETVDGQEITYFCHRYDGAKARIVRASDGKMSIQWKTAPVPKDWKKDSATFFWVCGLGCNLGNKKFDLYVNNKHCFTFSTVTDKSWTVKGDDGGELVFTAMTSDGFNDLFGYMRMTLPSAWIVPGEPLLIKIVGEAAKHRAWVMTFEFPDALAYFQSKERKAAYHSLTFRHLGTAVINLVSYPEWAGKTVELCSGQDILGKAVFSLDRDISTAAINIPRDKQSKLRGLVSILVEGKKVEEIEIPDTDEIRLKAFLDEDLSFERHVFPPGDFPKVDWKRPGMVDNEAGEFDLKVTFYDGEMNQVDTAKAPGRYGAVVEGITPASYCVRRYVTLFCCKEGWDRWDDKINVEGSPFTPLGIPADIWKSHKDAINGFFSGLILDGMLNDCGAGAFWASLSELGTSKSEPSYKSNPWNSDRQWWVTFKRREFGAADKYPALSRPIKLEASEAVVLKPGNPSSAGYTEEQIAEIRKICKEWAETANEPLATLVAHKGIIVFHEAFGKTVDGKDMTLETPTWMASITKLLTGCLMMEFVDQGLIGLDDPVEEYLPEFKCKVETPLTIRHLFTHTSGFWGHGTWGGDWSSSLENTVAHYLPYLKVGKKHWYNGVGYAVAGKVMERVSGKAIPYLFQEHLFDPLGAEHTKIEGTSGDSSSICLDIARVGQMLLNRGSYGQYCFFSEETFEKMMPVKLDKLVPGLDLEWGIGATWCGGSGLSKKTFGHGAASGAILRIDPEHELVIVSTRNTPGSGYEEYSLRLLEACTAPFITKTDSTKIK